MSELEDMQRRMAEQGDVPGITERLDQISMFLEPTYVKGQESYDLPRKPLVAKELSVGHIKEEHMRANMETVTTALEFLDTGQLGLGMFLMKTLHSEFKQTMSIDGEFINNVTKQELRYTHTQHLYQHEEEQKKKRWGRTKNVA